MNILYVLHQFYPYHHTGTEKITYQIASMQRLHGDKVMVVANEPSYDGIYHSGHGEAHGLLEMGDVVYKKQLYKGLDVINYQYKEHIAYPHSDMDIPYGQAFVQSIIDSFKPDIMHICHPMRISPFVDAAVRNGIPYVITLTDFWMVCLRGVLLHHGTVICKKIPNAVFCRECSGYPEDKFEKRKVDGLNILYRAKRLFAPSKFLAEMMEGFIDGVKIHVMNHGMDYSGVSFIEKKYSAGQTTELVLGSAGLLMHHKGVHVLINALREIPDVPVRLKIYGSGDKDYIEKLKRIADYRVEFMGVYNADNISKVFSEFDIFMVPSIWYETYVMVMHEAFIHGIPVIGTNIGAMAEKIKHGVNGYTFPPEDYKALAEIIRNISENPEILNDLKVNVRRMLLPTIAQEAYEYHNHYVDIVYDR